MFHEIERELTALDVLFAIGAYYTSFPGASTAHEHHFHRALALAKVSMGERLVNRVSFLLAQCFYLLAVCRTDRYDTSSVVQCVIFRKLTIIIGVG